MTHSFQHQPVLLKPLLDHLPQQIEGYLDLTLGGAGHARAILERFPQAKLTGVDRDQNALTAAGEHLATFSHQLIHAPFSTAMNQLEGSYDLILADLGVSSHQLDTAERGFSFRHHGPLDMRMDTTQGIPASEWLSKVSLNELTDTLKNYGEEPAARKIAQAILDHLPYRTTTELSEVIIEAMPKKYRFGKTHPATKSFQAIRIAVNHELDELKTLLDQAPKLLKSGGRIAIISFHSLEDRMVKRRFKTWIDPCICPKDIPHCICGQTPVVQRVHKKALIGSHEEIRRNPRARSARLRIVQKI